MTEAVRTPVDWRAWQADWDRQQEVYLLDRERRFEVMFDVVEAVTGGPGSVAAPRVLDLACGTASISLRLLERFPGARTVCVDVDPALLRIAEGTLGGDERVTFVRADLTDPAWVDALPPGPYDAVLTATALHWLPAGALSRLYRDLAERVLRPGAVFCNADHMPEHPAPVLAGRLEAWREARRERLLAAGATDWEGWWERAGADPALADAVAERNAFFAAAHPRDFTPPLDWHLEHLRRAGFAEATVVWRMHGDAVLAALR